MNKANTERLFKEFKFFHPEKPVSQGLMAFGFCFGDGWFNLVYKLCKDLELLVDDDFEVVQAKEKFGELRWYCDGIKEQKIYDIIHKAEAKSHYICEGCGKEHKNSITKNVNNWYYTLCSKCLKEFQKERKALFKK